MCIKKSVSHHHYASPLSDSAAADTQGILSLQADRYKDVSPQIIDAELQAAPIGKIQKAVFLLVFIGLILDVFEQSAVGNIAPVLRKVWHLSATEIGFLNTVTFLAAALGKTVSGWVADRVGRRNAFNVNLIFYVLGGIVCAAAPNYYVLCAGRMIVGLGLGGEIVTGITLLSEFFSPSQRRMAIGLTNLGAGGFGNMLAPAFAMLVFSLTPDQSSWRWLFVVLVLPGCLLIILRRNIPETPYFLLAKNRFKELAHVMDSLTSSAAYSRPVLLARDTIPDRDALQTSFPYNKIFIRTLVLSVLTGLSYGVQMSALTLMPVIFQSAGRTAAQALSLVSLCQSGGILGALAASFLSRICSSSSLLIVGASGGMISSLLLSQFLSFSVFPEFFGFFFYFSVILINTILWIIIPENFPTIMRGKATALILAVGNIMGALVPLLAGVLFDNGKPTYVLLLSAALYLLFTVLAGLMPRICPLQR